MFGTAQSDFSLLLSDGPEGPPRFTRGPGRARARARAKYPRSEKKLNFFCTETCKSILTKCFYLIESCKYAKVGRNSCRFEKVMTKTKFQLFLFKNIDFIKENDQHFRHDFFFSLALSSLPRPPSLSALPYGGRALKYAKYLK